MVFKLKLIAVKLRVKGKGTCSLICITLYPTISSRAGS